MTRPVGIWQGAAPASVRITLHPLVGTCPRAPGRDLRPWPGMMGVAIGVSIIMAAVDGWLVVDGLRPALALAADWAIGASGDMIRDWMERVSPPILPVRGWIVGAWSVLVVATQEGSMVFLRRGGTSPARRQLFTLMLAAAAIVGGAVRAGEN